MLAEELRMSKVLTLNFSNYMVAAVVISVLSGCVEFTSANRVSRPDDLKPGTSKASTEREPTPEEIVKDPERFDKYISSSNSCEVLKVQFNEESMQAESTLQNLTIERLYQRVVRKNCAGEVESDQVETVVTPTKNFDLKIPGDRRTQSFFVYNDETCAHKLATMKDSDGLYNGIYPVSSIRGSTLRLSGDMADAWLTFHMREGLNNIYVKYFYDCSPNYVIGNIHVNIGRANCREAKDSLIVQYPVFVTYNKRTLDGVKEKRPTPQACAPQSKTP
jgi:hypothetical protein